MYMGILSKESGLLNMLLLLQLVARFISVNDNPLAAVADVDVDLVECPKNGFTSIPAFSRNVLAYLDIYRTRFNGFMRWNIANKETSFLSFCLHFHGPF